MKCYIRGCMNGANLVVRWNYIGDEIHFCKNCLAAYDMGLKVTMKKVRGND